MNIGVPSREAYERRTVTVIFPESPIMRLLKLVAITGRLGVMTSKRRHLQERLNDLTDRSMATAGRGGFDELYAQHFSVAVGAWIGTLPDAHRKLAQELASKHADYVPDRPGQWVYDGEDNDICHVQQPRRSYDRRPTTPATARRHR